MCTENSDSDVLMMQSADHGVRRDTSDLLNLQPLAPLPSLPRPARPVQIIRLAFCARKELRKKPRLSGA